MGKYEQRNTQKKQKKRPIATTLNWIFSVLCLTAFIGFGFCFASIVLTLVGVASMPIKSIRNIWKKILPAKMQWCKPVLLAVLFFWGANIAPSTGTAPEALSTEPVSVSETTSAIETTVTEATEVTIETTAAVVTEPSTEAPTEVPTEVPTEAPTEAPTEKPREVPAETEPKEEMVWIPTKGGKRYHSYSSCSGMDDPAYVTISEAKARGFTPCKRC